MPAARWGELLPPAPTGAEPAPIPLPPARMRGAKQLAGGIRAEQRRVRACCAGPQQGLAHALGTHIWPKRPFQAFSHFTKAFPAHLNCRTNPTTSPSRPLPPSTPRHSTPWLPPRRPSPTPPTSPPSVSAALQLPLRPCPLCCCPHLGMSQTTRQSHFHDCQSSLRSAPHAACQAPRLPGGSARPQGEPGVGIGPGVRGAPAPPLPPAANTLLPRTG